MTDSDPDRQSETVPEADKADLPSCDGCRKRKLKCSRQLPECSNCERLDTQCFYDGNKRPKPGLRSGAVESLSRRLGAIETYLFSGNQGQGQGLPNDDSLRSSESASRGSPPAARIPPSTISETSQPVLDVLSKLTQEIRRLGSAITSAVPVASTQVNTHQATPAQEATADDLLVDGRASKRRRTDDGRRRPGLEAEDDPDDSSHESFDGPRLKDLLHEFFERIQPWLPILHHTRFPERVADISQRPRILVILHAINVAALRFVTAEDGAPLPPDHVAIQVKKSRDYVLLTGMSSLSIENLQALTIVAFTDIGNGEPEKAWALIGSLTRTVDHLRLTVEPEDGKDHGGLLRPQAELAPPLDFIEEEERRRLFWNVFNLDRFCSSTTGRNTSLTAADVSRRLPVCGGIWYSGTRSPTPYFGIWTSSSAKIGNSITYLPEHYASPAHSTAATEPSTGPHDPPSERAQPRPPAASGGTTDMSNVGAFAYYIESSESFSRVTAYFLRQRVDFSDRHQLTAWLMRFKELDLRLVHWKLSLPREWQDSGMSREIMPGVMDPNMTNAHVTHNASMILLHHRIAYPCPELRTTKLPSLYSAETCQSAAVETANITRSYLEKWSPNTLVSPQMAFASFISARLLLAHWKFKKTGLAPEFWVLVECLEEMHRRWHGHSMNSPVTESATSLFKQLANRLRSLRERCGRDPNLVVDVSGQFEDTAWEEASTMSPAEQRRDTDQAFQTPELPEVAPRLFGLSPGIEWPRYAAARDTPGLGVPPDELSAISQMLMDQQYMDMDRVISFEDVMHTGNRDVIGAESGTGIWEAG